MKVLYSPVIEILVFYAHSREVGQEGSRGPMWESHGLGKDLGEDLQKQNKASNKGLS